MTNKEVVKNLENFFNNLEEAFNSKLGDEFLAEASHKLANRMMLQSWVKENYLEENKEIQMIKSSLEELLKAFE